MELLLLGGVIYFIPAIVAAVKRSERALAIFLLNLFLGWTFLGWVGALVWAAAEKSNRPTPTEDAPRGRSHERRP